MRFNRKKPSRLAIEKKGGLSRKDALKGEKKKRQR